MTKIAAGLKSARIFVLRSATSAPGDFYAAPRFRVPNRVFCLVVFFTTVFASVFGAAPAMAHGPASFDTPGPLFGYVTDVTPASLAPYAAVSPLPNALKTHLDGAPGIEVEVLDAGTPFLRMDKDGSVWVASSSPRIPPGTPVLASKDGFVQVSQTPTFAWLTPELALGASEDTKTTVYDLKVNNEPVTVTAAVKRGPTPVVPEPSTSLLPYVALLAVVLVFAAWFFKPLWRPASINATKRSTKRSTKNNTSSSKK